MAAIQPENFSWVEPNVLAGMALPTSPANLQYLVNQGIRHLVSIEPPSKMPFLKDFPQLISHPIIVTDWETPTHAQINEFLSIVKAAKAKKEPVGIHCTAGYGRTGTFLACYLAVTRKLTGDAAIALLRKTRPGAVETSGQKKLVEEFGTHVHSEL